MSVEQEARKALRRMVFWRIFGELLMIPQALVGAVALLFATLGNWLKTLEMSIFYLELDAARRYKLLTGVDLAASSGAPARYGPLLNPDLMDTATRDFIQTQMNQEQEEPDE